jgi:redox-sensitive bicupin YhaK (pirin superfamily)
MPAITVPDITVLPRITAPDPGIAHDRPVRSITHAPSGFEGEGFPVRRAFAGVDLADLDPFVHLDQMGEVEYAPGEPKGTPWHPHRGFETVTYIIDGVFEHHDSNGGGGVITNGDTQWMTAGAGILHIETPPEWLVASGGLFHGFQLWVNLPAALKFSPARYQDIRAGQVALATSPDGGALLRVIAGSLATSASDAAAPPLSGPGSTHTPITLIHATLSPGGRVSLPWRPDFNALAYVMNGYGSVGPTASPVGPGQLAVFGAGDVITLAAKHSREQESRSPNLDVLILGGAPIREPVAWMGPFVMNTREELATAVRDFHAGRLGTIPAVTTPLSTLSPAAGAAPRITAIHGAPTAIEESGRRA